MISRSFRVLMPVAFCLFALIGQSARAEILISPTRAVLDRDQQSMELVVVNRGSEEFAYRVSLENMRMLPNGAIEPAGEARDGERFATDIVRFSPRRLVLKPNEEQVIRVSARLRGLEAGEYRSHLRLRSAPTSAGRRLQSMTTEQGDDIAIELTQIRSITVPVIVRAGTLDADVSITGAQLLTPNNGTPMLRVDMTRTGSRSTYGDFRIFAPGQSQPIYFARGIAVYTPNTDRQVFLPLPGPVLRELSGQSVRIDYVSSDPERPVTIAAYQGGL